MSEKVLGFYEEDSWNVLAVNNDKIFAVNSDKLVPVVSVEEHEESLQYLRDRCDFWIRKVRLLEKELKAVRLQAVEEKE